MSQPACGFFGRRHEERDPGFPGSHDVRQDFPVLTAQGTPQLDPPG